MISASAKPWVINSNRCALLLARMRNKNRSSLSPERDQSVDRAGLARNEPSVID
jgi:hypothetical protein